MLCAATNALQDSALDFPNVFGLVDKVSDVLFCGQPDHHTQPVPVRGVKQRKWGYGVRNADSVDPIGRHLCEIAFDGFRSVILGILAGDERTIADALDIKSFVAHEEKFSSDTGAHCSRCVRLRRTTSLFDDGRLISA